MNLGNYRQLCHADIESWCLSLYFCRLETFRFPLLRCKAYFHGYSLCWVNLCYFEPCYITTLFKEFFSQRHIELEFHHLTYKGFLQSSAISKVGFSYNFQGPSALASNCLISHESILWFFK
jgi:hypothetical protein